MANLSNQSFSDQFIDPSTIEKYTQQIHRLNAQFDKISRERDQLLNENHSLRQVNSEPVLF